MRLRVRCLCRIPMSGARSDLQVTNREMSSADFDSVSIEEIAGRLIHFVKGYTDAVVAFSGGVDSSVVAAVCYHALGDRSVAVTGRGQAVAQSDLDDANLVAQQIGISHYIVETMEIQSANYVKNDARRCYYCKSTLYNTLATWAGEHGFQRIFSGTNLDDLGDYRPGLEAAKEHSVVAPLAELRITKEVVRKLAKYFGLSISEKPASPCLASRIAYGQSVTPERLRQIESAETYMHRAGYRDVRVRLHADGLVRIEIHIDDWHRVSDATHRETMLQYFSSLGFRYVTLDLGSRQSGSLNRMLPVITN
jgi:pyridinium-3,5-biscarboxylic acid mononucleotide sulfurtransferase